MILEVIKSEMQNFAQVKTTVVACSLLFNLLVSAMNDMPGSIAIPYSLCFILLKNVFPFSYCVLNWILLWINHECL